MLRFADAPRFFVCPAAFWVAEPTACRSPCAFLALSPFHHPTTLCFILLNVSFTFAPAFWIGVKSISMPFCFIEVLKDVNISCIFCLACGVKVGRVSGGNGLGAGGPATAFFAGSSFLPLKKLAALSFHEPSVSFRETTASTTFAVTPLLSARLPSLSPM
ncbi:hypothetical protein D1872_220870 [compost metagenome]